MSPITNHRTTYFKLKLLALVALFLGIGLFASSKIFTELTNSDLKDANQGVVHTQQVLTLTNEIKVQVQGMQNNSRGFLLSGETDFLDGAKLQHSQAVEAISSLISLIHTNAVQVEKLQKLRQELQTYKDYQESLFKLAQQGNIKGAIAEFKTFKGRSLVEQIMQNAGEIEVYENQILLGRNSKSQKLFTLLDQLNLAVSLLASGILFLSFLFIFRALSSREKQENRMRETLMLKEHLLDQTPALVLILETDGKLYHLNKHAKNALLPFGEKDLSKVLEIEFVNNQIDQGEPAPLFSLLKPAIKGITVVFDSLSQRDYPEQELSFRAQPVKGLNNGPDYVILVMNERQKK